MSMLYDKTMQQYVTQHVAFNSDKSVQTAVTLPDIGSESGLGPNTKSGPGVNVAHVSAL